MHGKVWMLWYEKRIVLSSCVHHTNLCTTDTCISTCTQVWVNQSVAESPLQTLSLVQLPQGSEKTKHANTTKHASVLNSKIIPGDAVWVSQGCDWAQCVWCLKNVTRLSKLPDPRYHKHTSVLSPMASSFMQGLVICIREAQVTFSLWNTRVQCAT